MKSKRIAVMKRIRGEDNCLRWAIFYPELEYVKKGDYLAPSGAGRNEEM